MHRDKIHRDASDQFPSKAQIMGGHEIKSDQWSRSTSHVSHVNLNFSHDPSPCRISCTSFSRMNTVFLGIRCCPKSIDSWHYHELPRTIFHSRWRTRPQGKCFRVFFLFISQLCLVIVRLISICIFYALLVSSDTFLFFFWLNVGFQASLCTEADPPGLESS